MALVVVVGVKKRGNLPRFLEYKKWLPFFKYLKIDDEIFSGGGLIPVNTEGNSEAYCEINE